jgi:hypothetical protein
MKITIPENINDITLSQYQKYTDLMKREDLALHELNTRKIQIFTGLKPDEVRNISISDYDEIVSLIDKALETEHEFQQTFFIKDVEFGFIPNLDKITAGEFIDIEKYQSNIEDLHKLMAVLFRPINKKDAFNNYAIQTYKGTEQFSEIMKLMPLSAVNGALVFFSSLSNELLIYIQKFTNQEQVRGNKLVTTF